MRPRWNGLPDGHNARGGGEDDVAAQAAHGPEAGRMLHPTGFALKTLQVLGSGGVAGVLGGFASHTAWVGVCFGLAGVLAALTFMDCRCACVKPGSDCDDHP
ncbi:MAG: hypothetical protein ACXWLG_07065 [Myxococcaceae bacterium]